MPGKLRNSQSWFATARRNAGFLSVEALAREIVRPKITVYQWERGSERPTASHRPCHGDMFLLKDAFNCELPELVEKLWREKIGDPCVCRCGGRKIFPDDPNAIKLVIEIACANCGTKRIREQGKQNKHRKFCKDCGSTVDRIEFTCVGYKDHNATRHAETCPGTMLLRPADISSRQWIKAHNPK